MKVVGIVAISTGSGKTTVTDASLSVIQDSTQVKVGGHEFHYGRIKTDEKMMMKIFRGTVIGGPNGAVEVNALGMYTHIDFMRYDPRMLSINGRS